MRIAITSNGPGEFSGWVRPLVSALLRLAPETGVSLFFVPDDYATGREPAVARAMFPTAHVATPAQYVRFALGSPLEGFPERVDVVQYLGGDLLHASRVRARLGGGARSYKFASKRLAKTLDGAFAVDANNAADLVRNGFDAERVSVVGNLAVDGAIAEAAGVFGSDGDDAFERDGVLLMPGTRKHEIANIVPLFLAMASHLRALRPHVPIAFAISPFTANEEVSRALERPGEYRTIWGSCGKVVPHGSGVALQARSGGPTFPIVRDAMRYAARSRLVVTLPGTKCIELAALGVPAVVCVPLNAPEAVVINGPLQYVDRIPFAGTFLKRQMVIAVDLRFPFTAQPNIDTGEMLMPELRGTQMPAEMARRILAYADDEIALTLASRRLAELYAPHAGAAERMARALLEAYA